MTHLKTLTRATIVAFGLLAANSSLAFDFTFEVPLEVANFGPGTDSVRLEIRCIVTQIPGDYRVSSIVAEDAVVVVLGPGPATVSDIVTVEMDAASPRIRPASAAREYRCFAFVTLVFPESSVALFAEESELLSQYETATGHTLTRVVVNVGGLIPR